MKMVVGGPLAGWRVLASGGVTMSDSTAVPSGGATATHRSSLSGSFTSETT